MTTSPDFDRRISAWMDDQAPMREPDGLVERVTAELEQTSRLPAWRLPERWLPMTLTARLSLSPPLRSTWTLLLVGLITLALVVSLALVGSQLLRENDPTRLNGGLMVPTLELTQAWDASTIAGLAPAGIDVGPDGNVYVVDITSSQILVLDSSGSVVRRWGERGSDDSQFSFEVHGPTNVWYGGISVGADGTVYVADTFNRRIQRFDPNGTFLGAWGSYGTGTGQFVLPLDVSAAADGSVFVIDGIREDIQQFTADGDYLGLVEDGGGSQGHRDLATGMRTRVGGSVYDVDREHGRLNAWSPDGTFHTALMRDGTGSLSVSTRLLDRFHLIDADVDGKGNLYVSDSGRILIFSPDGTLLSRWEMPPEDAALQVVPIAVAPEGTVYLSADTRIRTVSVRQRERADGAVTAVVEATPAAAAAPSSTGAPPVDATLQTAVVDHTFPLRIAFDLPPTWIVDETELYRGKVAVHRDDSGHWPVWVDTFIVENTFADPCHAEAGPQDPPTGPSVQDLTEALTSLPGYRVASPVTDITLDGHHGKTFSLETSLDPALCDDPDEVWLRLWTHLGKGTGPDDVVAHGALGYGHHRIAILDVDGTRVLLDAETYLEATPEQIDEANQVFESVDFG